MQKTDYEAKFLFFIFGLKEVKIKKYSYPLCKKNCAYLFNDLNEYSNYFTDNGVEQIDDELLELCRLKVTDMGSVIALKSLCDYVITEKLSIQSSNDHSNNKVKKIGEF